MPRPPTTDPFWRLQVFARPRPRSPKWRCHSGSLRPCLARLSHARAGPSSAVWALGALLALALAAAGCGLGPGKDTGTAELTITRDYGRTAVVEPARYELPGSETVLRMLDRHAEISTRYGGRFVQSIDGLAGGTQDGRRQDWFFYVNGVESGVGAADVRPRDGDRVWWDYRDWSSAMRVPAVVGSFPEPFLHGFEGDRYATRVDCLGPKQPCTAVQSSLRRAGVKAGLFDAEHARGFDAESAPTLRVLVGAWSRVGDDPAAAEIERGPAQSGVFARFGAGGGLQALDPRARVSSSFGPRAGLIAAVRAESSPPTWVVTGTGSAGVTAAARAFGAATLRDRYAVIVPPGGQPTPVPAVTPGQ